MNDYRIFLLHFLVVFFLGLLVCYSTILAIGFTSSGIGPGYDIWSAGNHTTGINKLPAYPNKNYYEQGVEGEHDWPQETLIVPAAVALLLSITLMFTVFFTKSDLSMTTIIILVVASIWGLISSITSLIIPLENVPTVKVTRQALVNDGNIPTDATFKQTEMDVRPDSIPYWFFSAFIIASFIYCSTLIYLIVIIKK